MTVAELIRELSAEALSKEVGCAPATMVALFRSGAVPGAFETDGKHWRCPRWAFLRYQFVRAGLDGDAMLASLLGVRPEELREVVAA